jgi:hypothetical protein
MRVGPGDCGMIRSLTLWRWAQPFKSRQENNIDSCRQLPFHSVGSASTSHEIQHLLLPIRVFLKFQRSHSYSAPADLIGAEPSTQGHTWKSSPMKMWCTPSSPSVCSVDSDTEETDGRATNSSHAMFQQNIQYRGLATVLTDVICFDDGFGCSLSE